jgi:hypothetical protein
MSWLTRSSAVVALLAVVFLAVGCGGTVIDDAKTEAAIEEDLKKSAGQKVSSVDCPSGVEIETGKTFDCAVGLEGGKHETATLKILNEDADLEITSLKLDK